MAKFSTTLFFGIACIILVSCKKSNSNSTAATKYDGSWKIQVLESGCGYSTPQNITITGGAFAVNSFGITCTPLVSYTFGISGNINSGGLVSGTLTSPNYGPPVAYSGACSSPDSCSATGSGIGVTLTK
jgi:hypothetical protein